MRILIINNINFLLTGHSKRSREKIESSWSKKLAKQYL